MYDNLTRTNLEFAHRQAGVCDTSCGGGEMTDEEMAEEYVLNLQKKGFNCFSCFSCDFSKNLGFKSGVPDSEFFNQVEQAYLAGLKAGKGMNVPAKWHDLRKDPNDLPVRRCIDNDGNVVRLFHNSWDKKLTWYRYDFHEREWWQMETEPIAWCEIPQYTEE